MKLTTCQRCGGALLWLACCLGAWAAEDPARQAREILTASGVQGGVIVHLGCGDGELTAALKSDDRYLVQGLDTDAAKVDAARARVRSLGRYGAVSIDRWNGQSLPYIDNLVNLVVAAEPARASREELLRVTTPGGVILMREGSGWKKIVKPRPQEIDEWTHFLHSPDNNAVADDKRVGPPGHLQWTAGPLWSRDHDVTPSVFAPVSASGRLFYFLEQGPIAIVDKRLPEKHALVARDAFNGVLLWQRPVSDWYSSRLIWGHIPVDTQRRLVAVGDRVYATLGLQAPVTALDAATGATIRQYAGTEETNEILCDGGLLVLVIRKVDPLDAPLASRDRQRLQVGYKGPRDAGEALMVVRADTGERLWRADRHCIPLTLAVSGGRVVFAEDDNVVCLDLRTGKPLWSSPRVARTVVVHDGVVLAATGLASGLQTIDLSALALADGKPLWTAHNGSLPNFSFFFAPVDLFVARGLVWGLAEDFKAMDASGKGPVVGLDLKTGAVKEKIPLDGVFTPGHHVRCYKGKATEQFLLLNKRGVEFLSLDPQEPSSQNPWVRGTCRYGILPCNGLLYAPPHSCACYPGALLNGFNALSADRSATTGGAPELRERSPERLERGPAYAEASRRNAQVPGSSDWPTYRHDAARSGASPAALPAELKPSWSLALSGPLSAPTVAEGKVFVASPDTHAVYALDGRSGREIWRYTAGARVDSPPTIWRGLALFGCQDGWVYCLRAADGALVWRFLAAPEERLAGAFGQLESPWPVHGSVLVRDETVYFAAGRSSFLDGGIRLYGLAAADGKPLYEMQLSGPDPQRTDVKKTAGSMPGALTDILTSDDTGLYMRHVRLDPRLARQPDAGALTYGVESPLHLMARAGFLDDTLFNRTPWQYGQNIDQGHLFVCDRTAAFGLRVYSGISWNSSVFNPGEGYLIFRQELNRPVPPMPQTPAPKRKGKKAPSAAINRIPYETYTWHARLPVRVSAMLLAGGASSAGANATAPSAGTGEKLFVAGAPDVIDPQDPAATFEGRSVGKLCVLSGDRGARLAELDLESPPVWNGMASAEGRLYVVLRNGMVTCLSAK